MKYYLSDLGDLYTYNPLTNIYTKNSIKLGVTTWDKLVLNKSQIPAYNTTHEITRKEYLRLLQEFYVYRKKAINVLNKTQWTYNGIKLLKGRNYTKRSNVTQPYVWYDGDIYEIESIVNQNEIRAYTLGRIFLIILPKKKCAPIVYYTTGLPVEYVLDSNNKYTIKQ